MYVQKGAHIIAAGGVARDAEARTTQNGTAVTKFSIKGDSVQNGEGEKPTAKWLNCVAWRDVAKVASSIRVSDHVLVAGKLQTRTYQGRDGQEKSITECICDFVQIQTAQQAYAPPAQTYEPDAGFTEMGDDDDCPF